MYDQLHKLLGGRVRATWGEEMRVRGTLVRRYRAYACGDQRSFLTAKQRAMLNVKANDEDIELNYCDMVVQAMAERLTVTSVLGDTDTATTWASDVLNANRFDGVQMDVIEASIQDGVSYVMVEWSNERRLPTLAFEPAWDGDCGLIPVYDRMGKTMIAALKVWYEPQGKRVNLYLPDRVVKYVHDEGGLKALNDAEPWRMRDNSPIGVPIIAFPNRKPGHGVSELASIIPLQDSLNRSLIDMIMTSGLTAFQIKVALGFEPPDTVAPGDWVVVPAADAGQHAPDAKVLAQGQLVPFISQCQFLIDQIGTISRTPLPTHMGGDTQSGEALKQREVGLLGKVERYQVRGGNQWEDTVALMARVQQAYGTVQPPPAATRWTCKWKNAEKRSDSEVIDNALKVADRVGDEEFLRLIAPVFDYDDAKIQQLVAAKAQARDEALARMAQQVPQFSANGGGNGNAVGERFGAN